MVVHVHSQGQHISYTEVQDVLFTRSDILHTATLLFLDGLILDVALNDLVKIDD